MSASAAFTPSVSKYIRNTEGEYVCPHCPKITAKQNTMYYHIKKNHTDDIPFSCEKCLGHPRFLQKSAYQHHVATIHPEDAIIAVNPYAGVRVCCPSCDHSTHTKSNILIHYARTHCKEWIPAYSKNETCNGCDKSFASSSAYLYHAISCLKSLAPTDHESIIVRIK